LIDDVKDGINNKRSNKAIKECWKKVENYTANIDLHHEEMPDKNKLCKEIHDLIDLFVEKGKTSLALLTIHFEFNLIKQFYEGRSCLKKLLYLGISMQTIVRKMVEHDDGSKFTKECSFMENILEEMQSVSLKQVDVDIKFLMIAGFCIIYGGCCIETNQNCLAIEINNKAIFLMKTLYGDKLNQIEVLKTCYFNLGVLYQRMGELNKADEEFLKAERMNKLIKPNQRSIGSIDDAFMRIVPFRKQ